MGAEMDGIRDHCLFGGALGSLLSILRFSIDRKTGIISAAFLGTHGQILATFGFNSIFAFLFSPTACELLLPKIDIDINQNSIVALSGAIAWAAPWIVKKIVPTIGKKIEAGLIALHPKSFLERLLRLWEDRKGDK
jgi:hypothetical protein